MLATARVPGESWRRLRRQSHSTSPEPASQRLLDAKTRRKVPADPMVICPFFHPELAGRNQELAPRFLLQASFGLPNELANLVQFPCGRLMLAKKLRHQRNHSAADF